MATKYILLGLAVVVLALAFTSMARGGMTSHPQTRTWLIIGGIFALVSAWLFYQGLMT